MIKSVFDPKHQLPYQPTLFTEEPYLKYVVKHHQSTTLHDDFRLEICGVLASWMVFSHPTQNPQKIIRAMMRPDHDVRYMLSERRIPTGEIGAGPMLVWDYGIYQPIGNPELQHNIIARQGIINGQLEFILYGKRLRGRFSLIRSKNHWSLKKVYDDFASHQIDWDDRSIISGRTLTEI